MISLLTSIGVGGSLGMIFGILEDPIANQIVKFAFKYLRKMSKGEHLSLEEKRWIRDYNDRKLVVDGYDYTEQYKIINMNWR
ncbi:MAG: hypothetical protein ACYTBY_07550 [Planctomycetota bacterium]|jgi:hypothetical protein